MKKRLWSILLVLCLMVSLLPTVALAEENHAKAVSSEQELLHAVSVARGTAEKRDKIYVGKSFTFTQELVLENIDLIISTGTILTMANAVTVAGNSTISGGGILKRGAYPNALITVPAGAELVLSDITIDGGAIWNADSTANDYNATVGYAPVPMEGSVIAEAELLNNNGSVTMERNAVLQNNYSATTANSNTNCRSAGIYNTGSLVMERGSAVSYNAGYNSALYNAGSSSSVTVRGTISNNCSTQSGAYYEQAGCVYNNGRLIIEEGALISQNLVHWTLILNKFVCQINGGEIRDNKAGDPDLGTIVFARNDSSVQLNGGKIVNNYCVQATSCINAGTCNFLGTEIAYNSGNGIGCSWRGRIYLTSGHIHDNGGYDVYRLADAVLFVYGSLNLKNDDGSESAIHMDVDRYAGSIFYGHTDNHFVVHPDGNVDSGTRAVMTLEKPAQDISLEQFSLSDDWGEGYTVGFSNESTDMRIRVGKRATLSLNLNYEGSNEPVVRNVAIPKEGNSAFKPIYGDLGCPEREGYLFAGWFTEPTGGTQITSASILPNTTEITAYAHWTTADAPADLAPFTAVSDYSGTYDGTPHTISVSTLPGAEVYGIDEDGSRIPLPTFVNAGTYTVKYEVCKEGYTSAAGSAIVTIERKELTSKGQDRVYSYTGNEVTRKTSDSFDEYFDISGTAVATEPGEYLMICTLKDEYVGNVTWAVNKDANSHVWSCEEGSAAGTYPTAENPDTLILRWAIENPSEAATLTFANGSGDKTTSIDAPYQNAASGAPEGAVISYSSNKTNVASVEQDGTVTPHAVGVVKITASYAGDETHQAASAVYWLTVTSDRPEDHCPVEQLAEEATCEEGGHTAGSICSVCGQVLSGVEPTPPKGHTLTKVPAKAPTYDAVGNNEYYVCEVCHKVFKDAKGTQETTVEAETLPQLERPSSGGNSNSSKKPQVTVTNPEGGTATAGSGTVTVKPNEDYEIGSVTVNGKNVDVPKSGIISGLKPSDKVTVTFKQSPKAPGGFEDIPSDSYYADAVEWAVKKGITGGISATTFNPNGICTRAQTVTFLWRAASSPEPNSAEMPFVDVSADSYYYKAVLWAVENGITKGTTDTTFSPDMTCNRGHIVTFLWRAQKSPTSGSVNPFTDVPANAYYTSAVLWAVAENITKGTTDTTFSPAQGCTRAQIVTFIYRQFNP